MNSSPKVKHANSGDEESIIYHGKRGSEFKLLIESLLKRGNLLPKYVDHLLSEKNLAEYDKAFTAMSANAIENYEVYELLGDISANKFIVWYFARRFPFLLKPEGVKVIARLRINYGARASFQSIAKSLGFWDFITATEEDRSRNMKKLLEDTFEAFLGATEYLLDESFRPGVGNAIVYDILHSIFDNLKISLEYNDLFDAKTRLKELCDMYKSELKDLNYKYVKNTQNGIVGIVTSTVIINNHEIASGTASIKQDAEQNAAKAAIVVMNNRGYKKEIPAFYSTFPKVH
jgi:dsRNA-specific ribonuclease